MTSRNNNSALCRHSPGIFQNNLIWQLSNVYLFISRDMLLGDLPKFLDIYLMLLPSLSCISISLLSCQ